mmetsp:Transcript_8708/g.11540  ORF Transcript_8708/g.11540 Transcript_8708/m.11540 type:complete len:409 (+) Transcript_8708:148-1374(+)|eukprot:CAMPEP_0198144638 /NCGR_PEP_ID=MMETSP1443-20131203/17207_1 /TAXON_ID=186043 /ORGANISM="Entomoneis sp., Strain CCMP2396" /LENGTH=408 /DNA_ID=CAMNT_0043808067 /DNA_START=76 /DNA_END=1302 /DNA_ORIENTATION=+
MAVLSGVVSGRSTLLLLLWLAETARSFQPITSHQKIRHVKSSLNVASTKSGLKTPGSAKLDVAWEDLGFEFRPTNSHLKITYKEGKGWGEPELVKDPYVNLHIGATALHYGQTCFEGLKAYCHDDGKVHMFRPEENAKRMQSSCRRIMMPELPTEIFVDAVKTVVRDNIEFVPPYGSGGALYIRPLLFGAGCRIGVQPADEYQFLIMVIPVGDYYKGGLASPVDCMIIEDFDRAAPRGVGNVKVAGNYAADLLPNMLSKKKGFQIGLYLDAKTQTHIEEFSTSNFVGIDNVNKRLITPKSPSVLPSITNKSLMQIARDIGFDVEEREIPFEELASLDEILAVGTAVVVTPVGSVTRFQKVSPDSEEVNEVKYNFGKEIGPTTLKLYERVRAVQNGEIEDVHGWNIPLN